jgi:hypothetical protein
MIKNFTAFLIVTIVIINYFFIITPGLVLAQTNNTNTSGQTNSSSSGSDSGREASIGKYLCTPGQPGGIVGCIKQGYSFVLTISIAASVLLLVVAGYLYITGTEQSVQQAKSIISSTIAGLAILLLTYVILRQINPDLTELKGLEPLKINAPANTNSGSGTGGPGSKNSYCKDNPSICVNLKDLGVPTNLPRENAFVHKDLGAKLQKVNPGISWRVSEAYPGTVSHIDSCHLNATCVDISINDKNDSNWNIMCGALKNAGLSHIARRLKTQPVVQLIRRIARQQALIYT